MTYNKSDLSSIKKIAQSDTGKQLLQMISNADPKTLEKATDQAKQGDLKSALKQLDHIISNPDFQALLANIKSYE